KGFVSPGGECQHALDGRRIGDGVGGIHHRLPREIGGAGQGDGLLRRAAQSGEHNRVAELRRLLKRAGRAAGILAQPLLDFRLRRVARSQHDAVSILQKPGSQHAAHESGSQNADFHFSTETSPVADAGALGEDAGIQSAAAVYWWEEYCCCGGLSVMSMVFSSSVTSKIWPKVWKPL